MKFIRYYPDKFHEENLGGAMIICIMQFWASFMSEVTCFVYFSRMDSLISILMTMVSFVGISQLDNLYVEATHKLRSANILLNPDEDQKELIEQYTGFVKCPALVEN